MALVETLILGEEWNCPNAIVQSPRKSMRMDERPYSSVYKSGGQDW